MKRITFLSALSALLFMGYCSNAKGTNSPDAKTTDAAATPAESKTQAGATYYWFPTNTSGDLSSRTAKSNSATALDDCQGNGDPCGLGYDSSDTHIDGSGNRVLNTGVTEAQADQQSFQD